MHPVAQVSTAGATNLYGLDRDALAGLLGAHGVRAFHAGQVHRWIYARRRFDPLEWTDLPLALRETLARETVVDPGRIVRATAADDGTVKYRIALARGGEIEAVHMVQSGRVTLCVSSQVGCALDCDFCLTGKMGFGRHLAPGEIAGQVALVQDERGLDGPINLVFMGMGEPLHNYDNVMAAVGLLAAGDGFALSPRRITVSTSGLAPAIERLAGEPLRPRPRLAVSLNATTDSLRDRLMPVNRKYPLARLMQACSTYRRRTGERFTFEYVLLSGINDTPADVARLAGMARQHDAKLNLIPFNPVPGWLAYRPPPRARTRSIRDRLLAAGLRVSIRWSRGRGARAACGQLALLPDAPDASDASERSPS